MKKLIIAICALAVTCLAIAGPDSPKLQPSALTFHRAAQGPGETSAWSANFVFDLKNRKWDAVAINDLHPLTLHGRPTGFSFSAFAGTTTDSDGKAVAGVGLTHHRALFDQIQAQSFIGFKFEAGTPIGLVIGAGLSYRFGS